MFAVIMRPSFTLFVSIAVCIILVMAGTGCANMIPPTGGARDSLPPELVAATPPDSSKNARPSKITLTFNEYLNPLQGVQENVIISPTLPSTPAIESRLKTVTVRFRDTLEPNTTYSINFGNVITDVNEGNILRNFTYVFSTGNTIDTGTLGGKVILAETGKTDSTLIVVLHRNLADSAVIKQRPRYYAKLDGSGNFSFENLPPGPFAVYALPNDFTKQYDDSTKRFAFLDKPVSISANTPEVTLYAYEQEKRKTQAPASSTAAPGAKGQDKRLRFSNAEAGTKDILTPLQLDFVRKLRTIDTSKIILTDTNYNRVNGYTVKTDSTRTRVIVQYPWQLNARYKLVIMKDAVTDTTGVSLTRNDTIPVNTKRPEDYGKVRVRFSNIDLANNPVLQIVQNDQVLESIPLTSKEWTRALFRPGDYEMRILFDRNKNGVWDPGNFRKKIQPEIVQPIPRPLTVKGGWENETDVSL